MAPTVLHTERDRNQAFVNVLHGKSAEKRNAFMSMLAKDDQAHRIITDEYVNRWETSGMISDSNGARDTRKKEYMSLVNKYSPINHSPLVIAANLVGKLL
jgi:sterol 24-C-methyltransferase